MRYAMIHKFRHQHPVSRLCVLVDVAKSGYQAWCAGKLTADQLRIRELERELSIAKTERDILMALALGHPVGHPEKATAFGAGLGPFARESK